MMYRIKEIKKLLRSFDYVPVARKTGDGLLLRVPTPTGPIVSAYAIKRGEAPGVFFNSTRAPEEHFLSVPEYAIRLFIMAEVSACCSRVPISNQLICYFGEEGEEYDGLEGIVASPSTQEDVSKECFLTKLFNDAVEDNFPSKFEEVAENHGVYLGYRLIKSFFRA
jgi:hypothetical protein